MVGTEPSIPFTISTFATSSAKALAHRPCRRPTAAVVCPAIPRCVSHVARPTWETHRGIAGRIRGQPAANPQLRQCGARLCPQDQPQQLPRCGWSCGHSRAPHCRSCIRAIPACIGPPICIPCAGGFQCRAAAAAAEAIFRVRWLPAIAGTDHPGCARRQGRVCLAADRRGEIALLPVAGDGAGRTDGGGIAADRADEGPGRWAAGERGAGDLPQLVSGRGGIAGAAARDCIRGSIGCCTWRPSG